MQSTAEPPWVRFAHGAFTCTVVSDGQYRLGPARDTFPGTAAETVDEALESLGMPKDHIVLDQNLLIVDDGHKLILFDTGVGTVPALGPRVYGPQTGRAVPNMAAAGITPTDIDVVALTHAHSNHAWGLLDENGSPLFTNARIIVGAADFAHFTDRAEADKITNPDVRNQYTGARINLLPYGDAVVRVDDGYPVAPGIKATATPGHSPGHLTYEINSNGETMIVWGDLCHHPVLLGHPEWNLVFDGDRAAAARQRERIFSSIAEHDHAVLSYHFPFPGLGRLARGANGFSWQPSGR